MSINSILAVIVIHTLVCLIFFIINIRKNGLQDSIYKFAVIFFIPVLGFLILGISAIIRRYIKKSDEELDEFLRSVHGGEHIYHEEAIDFENEINTIPMEDSLEFSDNKTKRAYLIYILKKDFTGHVKSLQKALRSDDSETSHYAAAALMEIRKEFEVMLQNAGEKYQDAKRAAAGFDTGDYTINGSGDSISNISGNENGNGSVVNAGEDLFTAAEEYALVLKKFLKSRIADSVEHYDYMGRYSDILELLIEGDKSKQSNFMDKISVDIELDDLQRAFEYCKMFAKYHPESENAYLAFLKLFYTTKDYSSFKKVISIIKDRKIAMSEKSLSQLAYWEGSVSCS